MITWGISANSHDAALAVFVDEKLVFASHSERFSGIKNDGNLHHSLVSYAKQNWGNPDHVYWYERPLLKTIRQLFAGQGWQYRDNKIDVYLARYEIDAPITYTGHHHSHAAAGYYTSGFDQAAVLVIDSIGEFETVTIWQGNGNKLTKQHSEHYPTSLGLWYSAMTQRIGLKPNEDEYILMGMAAYGDPFRFAERIRRDFFFADESEYLLMFTKNLHRGCQDWAPELIEADYFDIAAAVQLIYEEYFVKLLRYTSRMVNSNNLVFMGGCALNCKANALAYRFFNNVWIMPNPGDAGSAIGTVLAHTKQQIKFNPYIGYNIGCQTANEKIVDYIVQHKICGIARGPAEFGPRALGNRSLVADPRGHDIKDRVNEIKQRQEFRPFAPMILEELAHEYFDMPTDCSPYMQFVAKCKQPDLFPAIVHADGTSRVQTVGKQDNPQVRQLLEIWYARTGCPMLLNTSLNIKGEPMANDHADAARFERKYGVKVFN
jgi:carbamoyltransferase